MIENDQDHRVQILNTNKVAHKNTSQDTSSSRLVL